MRVQFFVLLVSMLAIGGCASKHAVPYWSLSASDSSQRAIQAQLEGDGRAAKQEWAKANHEVAKTGRAELMARLALMECAVQLATLVWTEDCNSYRPYALDARSEEAAYFAYLYGGLKAGHVKLLPVQHQQVAAKILEQKKVSIADMPSEDQPVARLIAVASALRSNVISVTDAFTIAEPVATYHGWRNTLMAWIVLQQKVFRKTGQLEAAEVLERRLKVLMKH